MPGLAAVGREDLPEPDPRQARAAARIHEQPRRRALLQQRRPALFHVARHPRRRLVAERHEPLLAALAGGREIAAFEVEVLRLQVRRAPTRAGRWHRAPRSTRDRAGRAAPTHRAPRAACRLPRPTGTSAASSRRGARADRRPDYWAGDRPRRGIGRTPESRPPRARPTSASALPPSTAGPPLRAIAGRALRSSSLRPRRIVPTESDRARSSPPCSATAADPRPSGTNRRRRAGSHV